MARPRNNIARLPVEQRLKIAELLDDGATYDEVRSDAEIAAACAARDFELHSSSFIAYRESAEYDEYRRARRRYGEEIERRRIAAEQVAAGGGDNALARIANFELLRIVLAKLEAGDELEAKELSALSRALAPYAKSAAAAREGALQKRVAELETKLAKYSSSGTSGVLDAMDKFVKGE